VLDDMEVEALKEVGESTGLLGVGAAVTEVGLFFRQYFAPDPCKEVGESTERAPRQRLY